MSTQLSQPFSCYFIFLYPQLVLIITTLQMSINILEILGI